MPSSVHVDIRSKANHSSEFLSDLFEIVDYFESTLRDPAVAEHITQGTIGATEFLTNHPESGTRVFLPGGLVSGFRFLSFPGLSGNLQALSG